MALELSGPRVGCALSLQEGNSIAGWALDAHSASSHGAAGRARDRHQQPTEDEARRRKSMHFEVLRTQDQSTAIRRFSGARAAIAALIAATVLVSGGEANAVIYCKAYGVPRGCVARPPVVRAPVVRRPVVYCKTYGVPKGCIMR
jgi:hypothetical protein